MSASIYYVTDGLEIYVGSTKLKLQTRFRLHKFQKSSSLYKYMQGKNVYDFQIYLIETCDNNEQKIREQFWIDEISTLNKQNALVDPEYHKKYSAQNCEKKKEVSRIYHAEHRELINALRRR